MNGLTQGVGVLGPLGTTLTLSLYPLKQSKKQESKEERKHTHARMHAYLQRNPMHFYSEVSLIVYNATYSYES